MPHSARVRSLLSDLSLARAAMWRSFSPRHRGVAVGQGSSGDAAAYRRAVDLELVEELGGGVGLWLVEEAQGQVARDLRVSGLRRGGLDGLVEYGSGTRGEGGVGDAWMLARCFGQVADLEAEHAQCRAVEVVEGRAGGGHVDAQRLCGLVVVQQAEEQVRGAHSPVAAEPGLLDRGLDDGRERTLAPAEHRQILTCRISRVRTAVTCRAHRRSAPRSSPAPWPAPRRSPRPV